MDITPKGKRQCSRCLKLKRATEFLRNGASVNTTICNQCYLDRRAEWRRSTTGRESTVRYKRKWSVGQYGLTVRQYNELLESQGGVCAICETKPDNGKSLGVDHCHRTGKVRALLCVTCNVHLGTYEKFRERAEAFLAEFGDGSPLIYPQGGSGQN